MTDPRPLVRAWNLRVRSAIPLPGAMPLPPAGDTGVDLDIALASAALVGLRAVEGPYRYGRNGVAFTVPGIAHYRCDAARIAVDPLPGARAADVAALLVATAIPAVLWMRGDVVLHAAAAVLPGTTRAVTVLGRSGSGKSALLSRALAMGASIVADDSVRVGVGPNGLRISGLPGGYFAPLAADRADRAFHPVPPAQQHADADPGALVVLGDAAPGRLGGGGAVAALLAHRHRPRVARLLGLEPAALAMIARLCRERPIYAVRSASIAMPPPAG